MRKLIGIAGICLAMGCGEGPALEQDMLTQDAQVQDAGVADTTEPKDETVECVLKHLKETERGYEDIQHDTRAIRLVYTDEGGYKPGLLAIVGAKYTDKTIFMLHPAIIAENELIEYRLLDRSDNGLGSVDVIKTLQKFGKSMAVMTVENPTPEMQTAANNTYRSILSLYCETKENPLGLDKLKGEE